MTVFYLTLISVYIFSLLARITRVKNKKAGIFFLIIVILILVLVSGLRNGIGDTGMYKHLYNLIGPEYDSQGGYEIGFILFLKMLKNFSDNPQFMIIVTSIITNVLNVISMYIFTEDSYFEIETFLYITSGYYTTTMNGIRQSLAASIIFFSTILLIRKKFIHYSIVILLMATIHTSAIIMIPIYFIVNQKAWDKKTNILFGLAIVGMFFYQPLMGLLEGTKYGGYADSTEGGASVIRIAVFIVPVILAYLKKDILKELWKESDVFINMTLICSLVMMFSSINWIFARFAIYFQLYNFVVLSFIISKALYGKERRVIYLALIGCYFIFFYYEQVISLGMNYTTDFKLLEFLYY